MLIGPSLVVGVYTFGGESRLWDNLAGWLGRVRPPGPQRPPSSESGEIVEEEQKKATPKAPPSKLKASRGAQSG